MTDKPILILNGPNLNLLGTREVHIYGDKTLKDIEMICHSIAENLGLRVDFFQMNSEGALVDAIQASNSNNSGLILNAAAYSHTSVALADAIIACHIPVVEVHLSNVYGRETFRHSSYITPVVNGFICGFGVDSYTLALLAMTDLVKASSRETAENV